MGGEEEEVAALDRVLTRTVLTKDEDLQQVEIVLSAMVHLIYMTCSCSAGLPSLMICMHHCGIMCRQCTT